MNPERIDRIKAEIRLLVVLAGQPSFAELCKIDGFAGDEYFVPIDNKIVLWPFCSMEAVIALTELLNDGEIKAICCAVASYVFSDSPVPDFPLAETLEPKETLHWTPVYFTAGVIKRPDHKEIKPFRDWLSAHFALN